mgnify:CR=1 FL=1
MYLEIIFNIAYELGVGICLDPVLNKQQPNVRCSKEIYNYNCSPGTLITVG